MLQVVAIYDLFGRPARRVTWKQRPVPPDAADFVEREPAQDGRRGRLEVDAEEGGACVLAGEHAQVRVLEPRAAHADAGGPLVGGEDRLGADDGAGQAGSLPPPHVDLVVP